MLNKVKTRTFIVAIITTCLLFSGCGKRITTCDCADLTYELYQKYDKIIFSEMGVIKKALAMRKAKKELKKDERYAVCRKQGVRPLSIIYYPKNKKIFATCDSWISMEKKIDGLWAKIKNKLFEDNIKSEEDEIE
jgi:hypothetical protein